MQIECPPGHIAPEIKSERPNETAWIGLFMGYSNASSRFNGRHTKLYAPVFSAEINETEIKVRIITAEVDRFYSRPKSLNVFITRGAIPLARAYARVIWCGNNNLMLAHEEYDFSDAGHKIGLDQTNIFNMLNQIGSILEQPLEFGKD